MDGELQATFNSSDASPDPDTDISNNAGHKAPPVLLREEEEGGRQQQEHLDLTTKQAALLTNTRKHTCQICPNFQYEEECRCL